MFDSSMLVWIAAELAIVLLVICLFLIIYLGRLKGLIKQLEEKILSLRENQGTLKKAYEALKQKLQIAEEEAESGGASYVEFLDAFLDDTQQHHASLDPQRDIVLDISPDTPLPRQAAALRHMVLIAEKEAAYAGEEEGELSWDVLQSKYQQIVSYYLDTREAAGGGDSGDGADDDELEILRARVGHLESVQERFNQIEGLWPNLREQAGTTHGQLLGLAPKSGDREGFRSLMEQYGGLYNEVDEMLGREPGLQYEEPEGEDVNSTSEAHQMAFANRDELQQLRERAATQHQEIVDLKAALAEATTPEQQQALMEQMSNQLEQQERFLTEAETCSKLLEQELDQALEEKRELEERLASSGGDASEQETIDNLTSMVDEFGDKSKDMLSTIAKLEQENRSLKGDTEAEGMASQLSEAQEDLAKMQEQHAELSADEQGEEAEAK